MTSPENSAPELATGRIVRTWWPLAASWLLMATELPAVSAVVARLPHPEINLAAYGGVVFPLALIVESPIIMLLAASTALSKDWASYAKLRQFMMRAGLALTLLHMLIAFTPLYYFVAAKVIGAPPEIIEPARIGFMIMVPWSWAIAYRRFNQGVMIRFEQSQAVGIGTAIRLSTLGVMLTIGYLMHTLPGIVIATVAIITAVLSEAIYSGLRVQPILRNQLRLAAPVEPALTFRAFIDFYVPLAMTSLLNLLVEPIGSAALSRMPSPLQSLAVWPVISGLVFMLQSLGVAYNEVVVALLDRPRATRSLRRFANVLLVALTAVILVIAATPLSTLWFGSVLGLSPALTDMARRGLWLALPMPGLAVLTSWYQGNLVHSRRTRGITEAIAIFMVTSVSVMVVGVWVGKFAGSYVGLTAFSVGTAIQTLWLWRRVRVALRSTEARDASSGPLPGRAAAD